MPLGRRRPILRGAAVGAAAYHAGKKREQRSEQESLESQEAAAPAPEAPPDEGGISPDALQQLKQLGELHEQGVLTDEEFAQQKAKLLG
jgi:hypothetical protein